MPKDADGPTTFRMEFGYEGAARAHYPYVPPPTSAEMNERQKARATERSAHERALNELTADHPDLERRTRELVALGLPKPEIIRQLRAEASERRRRFEAVEKARR